VKSVFSADWVVPIEGAPIEYGAVVIAEGRIAAVGPITELGRGRHFSGAAIVPGFVNAHSHIEYANYAGFGDGLEFGPWLALHLERKQVLTFEETVAIARLGAAECLASGITTIADSSYSGAAAIACAELGLRAIVYLEVFGADPEPALARFTDLRQVVDAALSDRVTLGISPHAPYTVSPEVYLAVRELGLPVATHLAESRSEREWMLHGEGPLGAHGEFILPPAGESGIRLLAHAGALGPETIAAHCVDLEPDELELLATYDVAVAHCPRSNGYLGCGIAPLTELRRAGVRVGLGTDSPASTPSLDIFEEMRAAVTFARARERSPSVLAAEDALELATLGSARALGLEQEVGSLAPAKRADLVVVALEDTPLVPWENPQAAVVFGGSPERVLATLVGGEMKYEKGGFEWRDLRSRGAAARERMIAAAPGRVRGT